MNALTPEQMDWIIDANYPCMGRQIGPDSLVGIMDSGGDLVVALHLEDAQIVIERITSLRAQLTAREQENANLLIQNRMFKASTERDDTWQPIIDDVERWRVETNEMLDGSKLAAAEAEVERLRVVLNETADGLDRNGFGMSAINLRKLAALAPSQPPQTTETRG